MTRRLTKLTLATVAASLIAAPAFAQVARPRWSVPGQSSGSYQVAYDNGYRSGFTRGQDDARRGDRFDYQRHSEYRRADLGYGNSRMNRNQYRDGFRQGFAIGYREGYERGRYGRGYPASPSYGGYYPGGRGGAYGLNSPAWQNGFSDGYKEGEKDGRRNARFDPLGESRYRKGDHGYRREYGSREQYKNIYRDAFRAGYEQGYRDTRGSRGWW